MEALQHSSVGQSSNFEQRQKICRPFLKFKKAEAMKLGAQALDLRFPFGEIEVLRENTGLIRKQLGLKDNDSLEIISAEDVIHWKLYLQNMLDLYLLD